MWYNNTKRIIHIYITYISIITFRYISAILFIIFYFHYFIVFFRFHNFGYFHSVQLSTNCNVSVESVRRWSDMLRSIRLFVSRLILANHQSLICIATHYDCEICHCSTFYRMSTFSQNSVLIVSYFYVYSYFFK